MTTSFVFNSDYRAFARNLVARALQCLSRDSEVFLASVDCEQCLACVNLCGNADGFSE
jgi:hypothetical protein